MYTHIYAAIHVCLLIRLTISRWIQSFVLGASKWLIRANTGHTDPTESLQRWSELRSFFVSSAHRLSTPGTLIAILRSPVHRNWRGKNTRISVLTAAPVELHLNTFLPSSFYLFIPFSPSLFPLSFVLCFFAAQTVSYLHCHLPLSCGLSVFFTHCYHANGSHWSLSCMTIHRRTARVAGAEISNWIVKPD